MDRIVLDLNPNCEYKKPIAACIGYFDGLHLGHLELIKKAKEYAKEMNCLSALITFDQDPLQILKKEKHMQHIVTFEQRLAIAKKNGIDVAIILHFTEEMASLEPNVFLEKVLGQLNIKALVCGFDFHYGRFGKGNAISLQKEVDYPVSIIDAVSDEIGKISSTRIRESVERGEMESAKRMLGYPFTIMGKVIRGFHQGTGMGYPTANVEIDEEYILPKLGVYAGYCCIEGKQYPSMINLGHNPTIKYREKPSLEVHIFDFENDLYGRVIDVEFIAFIREEKKFNRKEELMQQLDKDNQKIRQVLHVE
ncbi:MAG: bifunctional riboflavin kinase/FAD synthetase [Solobacterium sp.]|nr:bifunctional riboflavin kinase/FAD synthetase [Solobacterium sp.]